MVSGEQERRQRPLPREQQRRGMVVNVRARIDFRRLRDEPGAVAELEENMRARGYEDQQQDTSTPKRVVDLYSSLVIERQRADEIRRRRNEVAAEMKELAKVFGKEKKKKKKKKKKKEEAEEGKEGDEDVGNVGGSVGGGGAGGGVGSDGDATSQDDFEALKAEGRELKAALAKAEDDAAAAEAELEELALALPNELHPAAPLASEEQKGDGDLEGAIVVSSHGPTPPPLPSKPLSHLELCGAHDLADFGAGAAVAGSRFAFLKNEAALLELALAQWAMTSLSSRGFTPILAPDIATEEAVRGCGFQPRGDSTQIYSIAGDDRLCLVGTGEIPLAASLAGSVLSESELPIKLAAFTHCFRTEAGAGGVQDKGLYRLHQFSKVEMFAFCRPEDSDALHEELVDIQRELYGGGSFLLSSLPPLFSLS